jgi:hypothetical protein
VKSRRWRCKGSIEAVGVIGGRAAPTSPFTACIAGDLTQAIKEGVAPFGAVKSKWKLWLHLDVNSEVEDLNQKF